MRQNLNGDSHRELIDTLWNVNINYEERLNALERELIDTLWNVNG